MRCGGTKKGLANRHLSEHPAELKAVTATRTSARSGDVSDRLPDSCSTLAKKARQERNERIPKKGTIQPRPGSSRSSVARCFLPRHDYERHPTGSGARDARGEKHGWEGGSACKKS